MSSNLIKILRLIVAVYIFYIAFATAYSAIKGIFESADPFMQLLGLVGSVVPIIFSAFYFYASYTLFKGDKNKYPAILGFFIFQMIIGLLVSLVAINSPELKRFFPDSPILVIAFYGIPISLLSVIIFFEHKAIKKKPLEDARTLLGEHVKNLSDLELREFLKR